MKELSTEEKARRYDEAIERANSLLSGNQLDNAWIYKLLPDLKESEDERMIKFIKNQLFNIKKTITENYELDAKLTKAINWLEKQGEQKSIDDLTQQEAMDIAVAKCFEQGEQKPVEFDDTNAKRMFIKALERVEEQNNKGYKLTDCDKNSWWEDFKNYTFCTIEPKSAWSEEDETTKNNISHIIRQYDKISKRENKPCWYIGDCLLWMQNIKDRVQLQPKQEWSEEDEEHIMAIDLAVNRCTGKWHCCGEKCPISEHSPWLKSLRPQNTWKPSDEQMVELRRVISGCSYDIEPLVEIEEHLKKLREE